MMYENCIIYVYDIQYNRIHKNNYKSLEFTSFTLLTVALLICLQLCTEFPRAGLDRYDLDYNDLPTLESFLESVLSAKVIAAR